MKTPARVLLSSVFGPYARDDEFGSRSVNPMELYHNQVTRAQGAFSLRLFHRSFGLLMLQANVDAPCTVLDFPTLERFAEELRAVPYDVVGIGAITPNVLKVKKQCELIRAIRPDATIVVGGHVANLPDLEARIDCDHLVRGDGIRWLRSFLGEDPDAPLRHPAVISAFGGRILGVPLPEDPRETAAIVIPSVGCPVGCNFCSTSAMFGGKGKFLNFYETGDELFSILEGLEARLGVSSFFMLDENFLLHRARALRLLELMKAAGKSWSLLVFSSARVLRSYPIEDLVGLGITWVWMGLEGPGSGYAKLAGVDTRALVRNLQEHGIRVLGSTIVGFEHHTRESVAEAVDFAVSHATDFHQFMLYTPVPGTPLHEETKRRGLLLDEDECPQADAHGQSRFNFRHPNIRDGSEGELLLGAFRRDYEENGPSLLRIIRTTLRGYRRYRRSPDARVRERVGRERKDLLVRAGAVWAMRRRFKDNPRVREAADALLRELHAEFGLLTRLTAPLVGAVVSASLALEERRLARGLRHEPPTFCERNPAARALDGGERAVPWVAAVEAASASPRAPEPVEAPVGAA